ncbi:hypothetical protein F4821DRAFT_236609 [Hypoxylon rubiginosum]|uniref:Uncharacterized protein n=1 Tax=Hypoxylon rubiginosum TaxID=110542 RepID=A0ACC0D353_9PEZI|nr:hypothetical protein F4821DRAFT_236609 [Hypoxylon rubiginosum]
MRFTTASLASVAAFAMAQSVFAVVTVTETATATVVVAYPPTAAPQGTVFAASWGVFQETDYDYLPSCSRTGVCYGQLTDCSGTSTFMV